MRKSTAFFLFVAIQAFFFVGMAAHAFILKTAALAQIAEKRRVVRAYGLTDLCLFTEARYTRHPSLADQHSPFQDGPLSLEHFPSGALVGPPPSLLLRTDHD